MVLTTVVLLSRDELAYQRARQQRENQIIQNYNNQGITKDYPQAGTNFWGNSPDNNFGFGSSNITENVAKANQKTIDILPNNNSQGLNQEPNNIPRYWDTATDGEKVWNYVQQQEGKVIPARQNKLDYGLSGLTGGAKAIYNFITLRSKPYTDKYKHSLINCKSAQSGKGGYDAIKVFSDYKEHDDVSSGANTIDSSLADQYANKTGRLLGTKYPSGDCDEMVQKYINKKW